MLYFQRVEEVSRKCTEYFRRLHCGFKRARDSQFSPLKNNRVTSERVVFCFLSRRVGLQVCQCFTVYLIKFYPPLEQKSYEQTLKDIWFLLIHHTIKDILFVRFYLHSSFGNSKAQKEINFFNFIFSKLCLCCQW